MKPHYTHKYRKAIVFVGNETTDIITEDEVLKLVQLLPKSYHPKRILIFLTENSYIQNRYIYNYRYKKLKGENEKGEYRILGSCDNKMNDIRIYLFNFPIYKKYYGNIGLLLFGLFAEILFHEMRHTYQHLTKLKCDDREKDALKFGIYKTWRHYEYIKQLYFEKDCLEGI